MYAWLQCISAVCVPWSRNGVPCSEGPCTSATVVPVLHAEAVLLSWGSIGPHWAWQVVPCAGLKLPSGCL